MADIAELIVALKLQDGVSSGLGRLNGQLRGMGAGFSQVGRGLGQVGSGLDRIATRGAIAAAAGLGAVVTAAVSFEDAFAGVRKTVDATEDQFGQLEDRLREMARTMPISFQELAAIAEAGGALGIAFDSLDEFTDTVAKLGTTTDLSADQAATSLGVLGNVLQLRAEDFDNFGSALVDLGNKGASTESAIIDIAERIGATGRLVGLSADEVLGFGAAVANLGIEAEAGGSAIQRFLIDTLTAVEQGGEGLETFARTAGVTADVFQRAFREDAAGAIEDFLTGLGKLPEAVQIQTLQDLGFNDVRITRTLLGLANDAQAFADSLDIASQAFAENSALGEEAAKRYATTASQLQVLKNNVVDAAVVIGDQLLPVINELTSEFVQFLNQPGQQQALRDFATGLGEGVRGLAAELKGTDFSGIIGGIQIAAQVAKTAFDAFRALPEPIQQLAVAALVANKLSGGAVAQIAGGLANIFGGALKTIHAAHVTVIGAGGGAPIPGGGGGFAGSLLRGAATGVALASPALAGVAAVEVVNFTDMRDQGVRGLESQLDNLNRSTVSDTERSIASIREALNVERPLLEGILFHTNIRPLLEQELYALQAQLATQQRSAEDARAADQANRTANAFQTAELSRTRAATVERLTMLAGKYDIANANLSGANRQLSSLNAKTPPTHPVTVNNSISIPVSISATLLEQRLINARLTTIGIPTAPRIL